MTTNSRALAAMSGVIANLILGLSSLYWKVLSAIPPTTLLGYRILLSLVTLAGVMIFLKRFRGIKERLTLRNFAIHLTAAMLVVINWGLSSGPLSMDTLSKAVWDILSPRLSPLAPERSHSKTQ